MAKAHAKLRPDAAARGPQARPSTWRDALGRQPTRGACYAPRSRDEALGAVADAAKTGTLVRAVGAGTATSSAARPDGAWVDVRGLRRVLPVTVLKPGIAAATFARAEAGMTLDELHGELRARGVTLPIGAPAGAGTLGGAVSTATHGSTLALGSIADAVASIELVVFGAEGGRLVPRFVRLEPSDGITCPQRFAADRFHGMDLVQDDELFHGAVVGLGATGVACAYTLAVRPSHATLEERREIAWSRLASELVTLAHTSESAEVTLYPHPTGARAEGETRDDRIRCLVTTRRACAPGESAPPPAPSSRSLLASWRKSLAVELAVPIEHAAGAVSALLDHAEAMQRDAGTASGPLTLRFLGASRHALAPSHGRRTCAVEVALVAGSEPDAAARRLAAAVEAAVPDVRCHWAMPHALGGADLSARFPDAAAWRRACRTLDPRGLFLNAMTRSLLSGGRGATG